MKDLHEYYKNIIQKYEDGDYEILKIKKSPNEEFENHLEAHHFMMYEWCDDHKDDRYNDLFDYIIKPNEMDYDFKSLNFEDFLKFLSEIKIK